MTHIPRLPRRARNEVFRSMVAIVAALAAGTVVPYHQNGTAPLVAEVGVVPLLAMCTLLIALQTWAIVSEVA